jgi:hypothetical protein
MSVAPGDDAEEAYEDYTLASPWERLTASLEDSLSQWLAAGPAGLVEDGEGGGSDTCVARSTWPRTLCPCAL